MIRHVQNKRAPTHSDNRFVLDFVGTFMFTSSVGMATLLIFNPFYFCLSSFETFVLYFFSFFLEIIPWF